MKQLGIDIGSRAVKIACFKDDILIKTEIISTMKFYRDFSKMIDGEIHINLSQLGLSDYDNIISTGYGRNNLQIAGALIINELKAHVYGALCQTGEEDFTLLDIGGQDFKIIKVEKGIITDMLLNDKCAASSGRYLENMSNILEIPLDDLMKHYENPVNLNSTCAVFGESELIGEIAQGTPLSQLAAGINYALFKRIQPQLQKLRGRLLILAGGVAENEAIIHFLQQEDKHVIIPKYPQLNGAIGCCYLGFLKKGMKNNE
ncbi:acyl-CoA dehydratase activase [Alkaliphilus peptidifermentans]|uniref:CoA-substrate-specific enzyme activase, putative n=1 Tax=Alkaliphilus peptidifermentans DSM 18978 TaxID=1120976 RepID=A0A1G5KKN7_9FIRM|nr:acyl-CoA dehydratase activase [Alkaliphilus peptidifermentans]SCZ01223.1 CoA-substrate-specific enzyme activase, putative [Alkaliphilus peptidifermentans DSM 18978]